MSPKVSICIPTFNGEKFLRSTLLSIENQTFTDYDVIVSDHGSTDKTLEIIKEFSPRIRIRLVECEPGTSVADNWNNAVRYATGMYVKLLCQDDILYSDCLMTEVKVLDAHPASTFCWSLRDIISPSSTVILKARGWKPRTRVVNYGDMIGAVIRKGTNCFGEPEAILIRNSAIQTTTGFSGEYEIDLRMWLTLWRLGPAVFTGSCLSAFRISPSSWTTQLRSKQARQYSQLISSGCVSASTNVVSIYAGLLRSRLNQIIRTFVIAIYSDK
jgi:glycosyltransferase involved in cell wall biosynthesis